MAEINIKVKLELTEGYEDRYTEACCKQLAKRRKQGIIDPPGKKGEQPEAGKSA